MRKRRTNPAALVLAIVTLLTACNKPAEEQQLYKRLIELESEFWFQRSTSQVLLNRILAPETQVVWSTNFHTAAPVPIGAVGPGKYTEKLRGIIQNDSIGRVLKEAVRDHVNVILVIGDGMGNMHMALPVYKRYAERKQELTMFEKIMKEGTCGYVYTGTADGLVTGSAASGTAIACGTKTLMNMVGVDPDGHNLESALAVAKKMNYKTALVSNSGLTDATPAVFYAHNPDRDQENDIASELLTGKLVDVALGGGGSKFIPQGYALSDFFPNGKINDFQSERQDTMNLIKRFRDMGYCLCFNINELNSAPENQPLLGLFSGGGMPATIDRDSTTSSIPAVNDMAKKALQLISADNHSYFTMIECARIDWEAHDNDVGAVYQAVEEMNLVLKTAYSFYQKNPEKTLLIFTADHETGGLEIAYRKMPADQIQSKTLDDGRIWTNLTNPLMYSEYLNMLNRQKKTVSSILMMSENAEDIQKNFKKYMRVDLSKKDAELIYYSRNGYKSYKSD